MERYSDRDRNSGVIAYEIGADYIRVKFHDGGIYLYTNVRPGTHHINQMKILAKKGDGLNAYINDYVKKAYAKKER